MTHNAVNGNGKRDGEKSYVPRSRHPLSESAVCFGLILFQLVSIMLAKSQPGRVNQDRDEKNAEESV